MCAQSNHQSPPLPRPWRSNRLPWQGVCLGIIATLTVTPAASVEAQRKPVSETFEVAPIVALTTIVPEPLRAGKGFAVESPVHTDGFLGNYHVKTPYGSYQVRGRYALASLVHELSALEQLQKFSDSKVFLDAAKEAGISIVTAPIRGVQTVYEAVTEPSKTYETIKKVPAGVAGIFSEIGDAFDSGYRSVRRAVVGSNNKTDKADATDDLSEQAGDTATRAALSYIGYNKREAKWYEQVQADPYTRNKPLRDKITRIASVQSAVSLGFKFVPGIGGLPYVGTITGVLSKAELISGYADPKEIRNKSKSALLTIGIPEEPVDALLTNKAFTPTALAAFVDALVRLSEVKAPERAVAAAARAKTVEGAWFHARALGYLARNHPAAIATLERTGDFPVARLNDGRIVVPLPIDYLSWTAVAAEEVKGLRGKESGLSIEIALEGVASALAKSKIRTLGLALREEVDFFGARPSSERAAQPKRSKK